MPQRAAKLGRSSVGAGAPLGRGSHRRSQPAQRVRTSCQAAKSFSVNERSNTRLPRSSSGAWRTALAAVIVRVPPSARPAGRRRCAGAPVCPMQPMRQICPASRPAPAPISMPYAERSSRRTAASSTPAGMRTVVSCGRRWSALDQQLESEVGQPVLQQPSALGVACPRRLEPSSRRAPSPACSAATITTGAVWWYTRAPPGGVVDVARQEVEIEVPARRPLDDPLEGPRRDRERRQAGRDPQALLRPAVGDVDRPVVDGDLDARRVTSPCRPAAARRPCPAPAARCRCARPSTSPRARPRSSPEPGAPRAARSGSIGSPHSASTRTTSAPWRSATSHMRSPNTPLTPMTTGSPGRTKLTKDASMPGRPGPAHGKGQRIGGPEHLAQAVVRAVEDGQELRIEMAEHGAGQRHGDFRVRNSKVPAP